MFLFLKLHFLPGLASGAVLLHAFNMFFPTPALLILPVQTQRPQSISRLGTEHGEYGALSSGHFILSGIEVSGG